MVPPARQSPRLGSFGNRIEQWLEAERDQLPLWLPIALGIGIGAWFGLPNVTSWRAFVALSSGSGALGLSLGRGSRALHALGWFCLVAASGCLLAWGRDWQVRSPVLTRAAAIDVAGRVVAVDPLPARDRVRTVLALDPAPGLPARTRLTLDRDAAPSGCYRALESLCGHG